MLVVSGGKKTCRLNTAGSTGKDEPKILAAAQNGKIGIQTHSY